jgi:hypothetical protein
MPISTCTACGEVFRSVAAFDKHRVGTYEPMRRRCLTTDEMIDKGFDIDKFDHWVTSLMDPIAMQRRVAKREEDEQEGQQTA